MQKEQFETRIKALLPNSTAQAMAAWTQYAQEWGQEEIETESHFYDSTYVNLELVKQHQGEEIATKLFNYGEKYVLHYFSLRGAAAKLADGQSMEEIVACVNEGNCDPTDAEVRESETALQAFQRAENACEERAREQPEESAELQASNELSM